jgi:hypothetical protein
MSLFAAWVVYPLVLLALCAGLGLLVDALCGRRLPGALVAPVGLAAIVVLGQFTTAVDATAQLTVPLLVLLAVLGAGLSLPWRFGRPDPWPVAAALAVFAVFGAPVFLSGHPTFAGYIKLDDTATWLALTDRAMSHGRDLAGLEPSSYQATLAANLPGGYPVGVFVPFGAAQKLVGGDLAWVFQPYLSFLAAMLSLCLWRIAGGVLRRPAARALVAFLAAQPALLFGYAMWGGIKELAAAALLALAAALAPLAVRYAAGVARFDPTPVGQERETAPWGSRLRDVAPLALASAALVGVLSLGGLVWVGPMLVALALVAHRALGPRAALRQAVAYAAALLVFVLPTLLAGGFDPFQSGLTSESELGNLIGPLSGWQLVGIWPSGDFRVAPTATVATVVLIALAVFAALVGLAVAWRRRAPAPLLFATGLLSCAAVVAVGSPWVGAKALATAAPVVLALGMAGALALARLDRLAGGLLALALAGGVLWSNVLAYGGVSLAPYDQLRDLERVGHEFAGQGPTLMTEYSPYGARHFLRQEDGEGASELRDRAVPLRGGGSAAKGEQVDTDRIEPSALLEYRTLVLRRSPLLSRPPLPYRLVWSGRYYEVWQRPADFAGPVPELLPLGGEEPAAAPGCGEVLRLARGPIAAAPGARLVAARHAPFYNATSGSFEVPRAGRYVAWLAGSVRGSVSLEIDGREVGAARHVLSEVGGFIELGETRLAAGRHSAALHFGGADLHPGSGGFPRPEAGPLLLAPAGDEAGSLVSVMPSAAERLCGRPWDWIEAVAGE